MLLSFIMSLTDNRMCELTLVVEPSLQMKSKTEDNGMAEAQPPPLGLEC